MSLTANLPTAGGPAIEHFPGASVPALPAWLGAQLRRVGAGLLRGMHVSRMRQARREIAAYRSRLPRPEGSIS